MTDDQAYIYAVHTMTDKQFEVWKLHHRHGMSFRAIALHLDLARSTVMDRYDGGCRRLRLVGVHVTPDGTHYLNGDK